VGEVAMALRVGRIGLAAAMTLLGGCELFPAAPTPWAGDEVDWQLESGTAIWSQVDSSCEGETWQFAERGLAIIERDRVTLWLETVPELTGVIEPGGQARIGAR
jgi:hypothetical protein